MNEPTRGADVGAKSEIRELIIQLARQGCSFVIASSELDELLGLVDRVLVMTRGVMGAEFARGEASKEDLILAAAKASPGPSPESNRTESSHVGDNIQNPLYPLAVIHHQASESAAPYTVDSGTD